MQKIEVDLDTSEVLMHLFSRPPVLASQGATRKHPPPPRRVLQSGW